MSGTSMTTGWHVSENEWHVSENEWHVSDNECRPTENEWHVNDNWVANKDDKFAKVRSVMCMLNERWLRYFPGDIYLSIDESMVPYFGRHGLKQHIHGKPIRFGYKVWILATRLGYAIQAEPYQGKATGATIPELGTIRVDRVEDAPLRKPQDLKKEPRGTFHQITDTDTNITLVRYMDNSVFTIASTATGVHPEGKAKRWSSSNKKHIVVPQPNCVNCILRSEREAVHSTGHLGCAWVGLRMTDGRGAPHLIRSFCIVLRNLWVWKTAKDWKVKCDDTRRG
ncbi:piggyBac transposable element-derived protein 3-like [Homalodisca vitripennis]|uniref:piggyBac transposable element-derived protein 3-like n=1 Tax=Homalodisca vitripennis TaxID=197043 RepID=UPI001EECAF35|nr:piggyBac transposable element-derived protein 3-like [Homalodisca vitripennis]